MKCLIADGNNIARFGRFPKKSKAKGRFKNLSMLISYCKNRGFKLITLVSPCLKYQIDDQSSYNHFLNQNFLIETPAGHDCDHFILELAKQSDATIISNDLFRDYKVQYPIIRKRRFSFIIVDDKIIIPQLTVKGGELCVQG